MSLLTQFAGGGIKSVQRGSTSLSVNTAVNTTITAVDLAKSFVTSSSSAPLSNTSDGIGGLSYFIGSGAAYLTSTTNLACISASGTFAAVTVYWEVIEFY